ncbi:polymerase [Enterococcus avium]|nr:polymerase [Enterococcus avium]
MRKLNLSMIKQFYFFTLLAGLLLRSINIYSLMPSKYDGMFFTFLALWGGILLGIDFFSNLKKKRFPYDKLLILFSTVILLSSIFNRQYGIIPNIKLLIWSCIYYFLAYEFAKEHFKDNRFFKNIDFTLIITWFVLTFSSLVMFFLNFGFEKFYSPRDRIRVGFLESRLFGLYGDPNYAATGAVIVIILSLYYIFKIKRTSLRVFLIANIFIQFIYIVLSGSRTGEVVGYILFSLSVFIFVLDNKRFENNKIAGVFLGIAVAIAGIFSLHILIDFTKDLFNNILNILSHHEMNGKIISNSQSNTSLVRKDVAESDDVSNLRFSIWKSALDIFKSSWLVGTSPKNMIPYAREHLPSTFIAQNGFIVHNSYLNVLASTGILGGLTFFSFCIRSFFEVVKSINWKEAMSSSYKYIYFLVVFAYALFGCINSEFVLEHTIGSLIFWLFLGRLIGSYKNIPKIK